MLVRENLVSRNILTKWKGFGDVGVQINDGVVLANSGIQDRVQLKTYLSITDNLSKPLEVGKDYSYSFYFENMREHPVSLRFNGLTISAYDIDGNFKGVITVSGKRISDTYNPQIQVLAHNPEYYVKFKCDNLMLVENEKPSELWIPAKADLPTNQQGYYPPDGDYNEIKAI